MIIFRRLGLVSMASMGRILRRFAAAPRTTEDNLKTDNKSGQNYQSKRKASLGQKAKITKPVKEPKQVRTIEKSEIDNNVSELHYYPEGDKLRTLDYNIYIKPALDKFSELGLYSNPSQHNCQTQSSGFLYLSRPREEG